MASSTHLSITLFVAGVFSIFLDHLSVEGNNQQPSSAIEGQGSSYFFYQRPEYPRDCKEVFDSCSSSVSNGVYLIKPDGYTEPFEVYCDNFVDSGGWTSILRRFDGSVDFNRKWNDYKNGFGFLSTEFWLGNDKLSFLTNQGAYELRIDITLANSTPCYVQYDSFRISDEWSDYKISTVGTYKSDEVCTWKEDGGCDTPDCRPTNSPVIFTDCNDVSNAGNSQDGVYLISPTGWNGSPFEVFCNMSIDGGNWTVIQRRVDGSIDFYRNWTEYKNGFGDVNNEFWLGNEKLHYLTQQGTYEYRFDFEWSSSSYYNKYTNFRVSNENNKYSLANAGSRTGTRGYSLHNINNTPFSTHDQDNDEQNYNCAEGHRSGWWHGAYFYDYSSSYCYYFPSGGRYVYCSYANPNGDYNGGNGENIFDIYGYYSCDQTYTEMKIRRIS